MYGNSQGTQQLATTITENEQPCVRGCREATEAKARAERSGSSLCAPPVHPIHHRRSALFSCSSTSREGWEAPILSWQPSAVHFQSHIITTFIFISIDTRPFPPLKLNQRGCRKGGGRGRQRGEREGGVDDEMPVQATAHCIPICMQMV